MRERNNKNRNYNISSGHIPEYVKIKPISLYAKKGHFRKPSKRYHDQITLNREPNKDFLDLKIPGEDSPLSLFSSPKNLKLNKKDIFLKNEEMKVKLVSAEDDTSYSGVKETLNVLIPQGYVVGIQTDVFFEALSRDGYNLETKELNSKFIFGCINGTAKLVRVGSELHQAILEKVNFDTMPKLDIKTMSVGEVFETKSGKQALFLGFVSTRWLNPVVYQDKKLGIKYSNMKLATLWLDLDYGYWAPEKKQMEENIFNAVETSQFRSNLMLKTKGGHGYVYKNKMKIDVSPDVIRRVRLYKASKLKNELRTKIEEYEKFLKNPQDYTRSYSYNHRSYGYTSNSFSRAKTSFIPPSLSDLKHYASKTKMVNMTVFGMKPQISDAGRMVEKLIELYNKSK